MTIPDSDPKALAALDLALQAGKECSLGTFDPFSAEVTDWSGRTVAAADLAARLKASSTQNQRFCLQGARVVGTVMLRDKTWAAPIELSQCLLEGGVDADYSTCSALTLDRCRITNVSEQPAISGGYMTATGLCLTSSHVEGGCDLGGATIKGCVDFSGTTFADNKGRGWQVDMTNANITGDLHLGQVTCIGATSVAGATISGQVYLVGAKLGRRLPPGEEPTEEYFSYSAFWGQGATVKESVLAQASEENGQPVPAEFIGYVSLASSTISHSVTFRQARFTTCTGTQVASSYADKTFGQTNLNVALDLYCAQVGLVLDLRGIENPDHGQIDLRYCSTKRLAYLDSPGASAMAPASYAVSNLTYTEIDGDGAGQRKWLEKANDGHKPGPYLVLSTVAQNDGRSADALTAKILASSKAAKPLERALLGWVSYGYRPYLVLLPFALLFLITLSLVFEVQSDPRAFAPVVVNSVSYNPSAKAEGTTKACDSAVVKCLEPVLFALDAVVPVGQGEVSTWRVTTDDGTATALYCIIVIDQYAGWALAGVFVAAIAGFLKRT